MRAVTSTLLLILIYFRAQIFNLSAGASALQKCFGVVVVVFFFKSESVE